MINDRRYALKREQYTDMKLLFVKAGGKKKVTLNIPKKIKIEILAFVQFYIPCVFFVFWDLLLSCYLLFSKSSIITESDMVFYLFAFRFKIGCII